MVVFAVGELDIQFPFVPYDVQKELMKKVVECIEKKQNGLLESPTGTGKTLSLLCAAIAWQKKQAGISKNFLVQAAARGIRTTVVGGGQQHHHHHGFNNGGPMDVGGFESTFHVPKIIYASRTHAQLSQAAKELKRSFYATAKTVVLGSRDVMCINDGVSRLPTSSAKILGCHVQVKSRSCHYYNNVNNKKEEISTVVMDKPVMDIEDLVTTGRRNRLCPFFMSRELVKDANVVFMPYNYLMDPKLRASHGVDLKNCIIILDEGHNIAKNCEESVSFEIKSSTITKCIQEVTQTMNEFNEITQQVGSSHSNSVMQDIDIGSLVMLKQSFLVLEGALDSFKIMDSVGSFIPANEILFAIFQNGFPPSTFPKVINELDAVSSFQAMTHRDSSGCDTFSSMLRILSSQAVFINPAAFAESFKIFLTEEKRHAGSLKTSNNVAFGGGNNVPKIFNFWCFNPAIGLEMMLQYGPRCLILASGTLSPLPFLESELRAPFPVKLSNPHIIGDSQLFATIVKTGAAPKNAKLSSAFNNRSNPDYLSGLGEVVASTCSVVPKGVLVFFPSYSLMDICVNAWKHSGLLDKIGRFKAVYVEPKGKFEFNQVMANYYQSVKTANGACLMAVCRGKVSEGLDFADDNGRAVIITGIPYAPFQDPHVQAKKAYLDSKKTNGVSGNNWYQLEAVRALNQAIGRIIRHAQDYGAVLLCDERFDYPMVMNNLSPWLESRLLKCANFSDVITKLSQFFKTPSKSAMNSYSNNGGGSVGSFIQSSSTVVMKSVASGGGGGGKPKVSSDYYTSSYGASRLQDIDMDCDISSMYTASANATNNKDTTTTTGMHSTDLFSKLDSLMIRPAIDYVKVEGAANNSRDILGSSHNSLKRAGSLSGGVGKRLSDGLKPSWTETKPKRIKMDLHRVLPYGSTNTSYQTEPVLVPCSSATSGSVMSMDIDMDSQPDEENPVFLSAKGFSTWLKNDLSPPKYARFVEVLKEFKFNRSVEKLGEELKKLFAGEKFYTCLEGLKFVMHDSTCSNLLLQLHTRDSFANKN